MAHSWIFVFFYSRRLKTRMATNQIINKIFMSIHGPFMDIRVLLFSSIKDTNGHELNHK